ncbi:Gustatory receptor 133, partial [Hyalella azteca]
GILTKKFKKISSCLVASVTESPASSSQSAISTSNADTTSRNTKLAENIRGIEEQILQIDEAVGLITDVYSWILIFMSVWYLSDLLFGIYLLMTSLQKGNLDVLLHLIVISEALCLLFLIHNPADALSDAEEDFIVKLRMVVFRLQNEAVSKALQQQTGLFLALQRPRKLTLGNFGNIGRSSFLNTVAFMLSYVVVTIQFRDPTKEE